MKKGRREFFEVFRRVPEEKEPTTWWRKNSEAAPADEAAAASPAAARPLPRREGATASNKVVLTLSRELLVVIAVAALLALVGAFVWGHSLGRSAGVVVASGLPAVVARTPSLAIPAPNQPATPYYTLRLELGSLARQNAEQISADWSAMGYDAFLQQTSASSWSVNIGRFPSYLTTEADAFKKKVSLVTYKNRRWPCSWQKVTK